MERIVQTLARSPRRSRRSIVAVERLPWLTAKEQESSDRDRTRHGERAVRVREVMPPHHSPNLTYEQALEGWRRLEEEKRVRRQRSRPGRPPVREGCP